MEETSQPAELPSLADLENRPRPRWIWIVVNAVLLSIVTIRLGLEFPDAAALLGLPANSAIVLAAMWALHRTNEDAMASRVLSWFLLSVPVRVGVAVLAATSLVSPVLTVTCRSKASFEFKANGGAPRQETCATTTRKC